VAETRFGHCGVFGNAALLDGYTVQHNIISYVTNHMLKPFAPRVYATYDFMQNLFDICERDASLIRNLQQQADEQVKSQKPSRDWSMDATTFDTISFHGSRPGTAQRVSGLPDYIMTAASLYPYPIRYLITTWEQHRNDKRWPMLSTGLGQGDRLFKRQQSSMKQLSHDTTL